MTTEYPSYSARLARFHAQTVTMIEDVISKPLSEGYALLDIMGKEAPGAEVRSVYQLIVFIIAR